MPTSKNAKIATMVKNVYGLVTTDCAKRLDGLKFVVVGDTPFTRGNPALYINKSSKAGLLKILSSASADGEEVTKSDTIVIGSGYIDDIPLIYGVLIHEMGHAYCEISGALPNTEKNAYIFETNWICKMAADANHPYSKAMCDGFKDYFAKRTQLFNGVGVLNLHNTNVKNYGLSKYA